MKLNENEKLPVLRSLRNRILIGVQGVHTDLLRTGVLITVAVSLCLFAESTSARVLQVLNVVDGSPIQGALVTVSGNQAVRTDSTGHVQVPETESWGIKAAGFASQRFLAGSLAADERQVFLQPFKVHGIFISQAAFLNPIQRNQLLTTVSSTSVNSVVLDVKSRRGDFLLWHHADELRSMVDRLHQNGFYVVLRFSVFRDVAWAKLHPSSLLRLPSGRVYHDENGSLWLDPSNKGVVARALKQISEVAGLGADEIQLDSVNFPANLDLPSWANKRQQRGLTSFLLDVSNALRRENVFVSAGVDNLATKDLDSPLVAKDLKQLASHVDYLSVLLNVPDQTLHAKPGSAHLWAVMNQGLQRIRKESGLTALHIRPWIHASDAMGDGDHIYGRREIAEQVASAEMFGSGGYVLWSSDSYYDPNDLLTHDHYTESDWSESLAPLLNEQLQTRQIHGSVIYVGQSGHLMFRQAYGYRQFDSEKFAMTTDTVFDLDSITKAVATTTAIMQLVESGSIDLDAPVSKYWPEFGSFGKNFITVRSLLASYSGLRPDLDLSVPWQGYGTAMHEIVYQKPVRLAEQQYSPSDVDFEILGELVQRISGVSLQTYCEQNIFKPLGMTHTRFMPPDSWDSKLAFGIDDSVDQPWRHLFDPTAIRMGGVAGHAGLFSTADDLTKFVQMLLNFGEYQGVRILSPGSVVKMTSFASPQPQGKMNGLGWQIGGYRGQSLFPADSFGVIAHTGSMIWVQPERRRFLIFLTNAGRTDPKMKSAPLRKALLEFMNY